MFSTIRNLVLTPPEPVVKDKVFAFVCWNVAFITFVVAEDCITDALAKLGGLVFGTYAFKIAFTFFDYLKLKAKKKLLHYLEHTVSVENGITVVSYTQGERKYKICFPRRRGVKKICKVFTLEDKKDVTEEFMEYLGPGNNFHSIPTTPQLLGWDCGLVIQYTNGKELEFSSHEKILLTC